MPVKDDIIGSYAAAGRFDRALALARSLRYAADRNLAFQTIATTYAGRDDFPDSWVASIDSDHDGQPDFFNPLATAADIGASGLVLDADSDNDGIADPADRRPLLADHSAL